MPVSTQFDDPYYSLENGLAETRHVFLDGNALETRLSGPLHVAELGFGTGLNFLALVEMRRALGTTAPLRFTSFEAFPLSRADMAQALRPFTGIADLAAQLEAVWDEAPSTVSFDKDIELRVVVGDARETVPGWEGAADAWFLDGFSPAKNPELWSHDLMHAVYARTRPGGTFATYTAAGGVRRALADAGFEVERQPGYGRKRHMTVGRRP